MSRRYVCAHPASCCRLCDRSRDLQAKSSCLHIAHDLLQARSLASASCVCSAWRQLASLEYHRAALKEQICSALDRQLDDQELYQRALKDCQVAVAVCHSSLAEHQVCYRELA